MGYTSCVGFVIYIKSVIALIWWGNWEKTAVVSQVKGRKQSGSCLLVSESAWRSVQ